MLDNNTDFEDRLYNGFYDDVPFEMSMGTTENIPSHIRTDDPLNIGNKYPIIFEGLAWLKYHLEYCCPPFFYYPGRLGPERKYYRPTGDGTFHYPKNEPAVIVFEAYGAEGSHENLWATLSRADPNLLGVGYVATPAPTGSGWRFHCLVESGRSILRYGPLFAMRCWVHGLSGVHQIEPGTYVIREYVNAEAFKPGYLLSQADTARKAPIEFRPGGLLRTQSYPPLNQNEKAQLVNNCAQAIARCPLSDEADNVDRLARTMWYGANHDAQPTMATSYGEHHSESL